MKIYAVRHGQTDWNHEGRIQGQSNTRLNDEGRAEARAAAEIIPRDAEFIITSPMARAVETAEIINKQLGLEIVQDDRLKERSFGDYEGLLRTQIDITPLFGWNPDSRPPNGETSGEMANRVFSFIDDAAKKYSDKTILIVTHSQILRAFHWYFYGFQKAGEAAKMQIKNCELYVFETP